MWAEFEDLNIKSGCTYNHQFSTEFMSDSCNHRPIRLRFLSVPVQTAIKRHSWSSQWKKKKTAN